jgi:serine/threonine-protein kinase
MEPHRWQQVRSLFQAALVAEPAHRTAHLAAACGGDAELRAEVESLLAAYQEAAGFLSSPAEEAPEPLSLQRIGPYQVAQRLGAGGMGVVYLGLRADGEYQRRVAIKVLKPGLDSEEVIRRFRTERQILAALEHPNIARLLDGGTTEHGLPYFVMEYVEGRPIDVYCQEDRLALRQRLELFLTVCSAVELAHRNLVVHRDLKPGNILVTADGMPKLLDFGIAKLLNPELSSVALGATAVGLQPMTPDYASPEQVRGEHVNTASDVYSLGVLLYELLTGRHPYRSQASDPAEIRRLVTDQEPRKPSLAAAPGEPLARQLAGDLDNIVLKALRKEPSRRYASVEQLAEDIRRHLSGQPVLARPGTWGYRASKFVQRHRMGVATAAALLLAVLSFGIGMSVLAARLARERDHAEQEQQRAEQVTAFLTRTFEISDPGRSNGETVTARALLDEGVRRLLPELTGQPEVQADLQTTIGTIYQRLGLPDRAQPLLEASRDTRRRLYGDGHPKLADSLSGLAAVEEDRVNFPQAIDMTRQALAIRRRWYGDEHETVARSLNHLGMLLRRQGHLPAAERNLRSALTLRRHLPGPPPLDVAESLNDLGVVLWEQGRYTEAEQEAREALALRRRVHGPVHVEIADTLNLLAAIRAASGDWPQAENLMRQALEMRRRLYQGDHPRLAESLNNLGALLKDRGRPDEAEPVLREALAMRRRLFGNKHPSVATTLANLGWIALAHQEGEAAERLFQESLEIRVQTLGQNHSLVSDSLSGKATALEKEGKLGEAEETLRETLRIRRSVLGDQHPNIAETLEQLARLLMRQHRPAEAEALMKEAVVLRRHEQPVIPVRLAEAKQALAALQREVITIQPGAMRPGSGAGLPTRRKP